MATCLEVFDALRAATRGRSADEVFPVNIDDYYDLCKLRASDLLQRGYSEKIAEEVSSALAQWGDLGPLGQTMGIHLAKNPDAPSLLPESPSLNGATIPESHKEELDRRLAAADADPAAGRPWEEVRARLRGGR